MSVVLGNKLFKIIDWYSRKTHSSPIVTKALTSFTLYGIGDALAQTIFGGKRYDKTRTVRLSLYGLIVVGPFSHIWYNYLERLVEKRLRIRSGKAVVAKVVLDQFLCAPPMTVLFFSYMAFTSGTGVAGAMQSIKTQLLPTLKVNWVVWPAAQTITFGIIPLDFRVLFISLAAVFWACFLSCISTKDEH
jgi:protein Mpv17